MTESSDRTLASDAERLRALRITKGVATGALVLCIAVFLAARAYASAYPWLGFVAAFAEAAAIGGLADWYAVVALFRRPLGLPIPHTAIIPRNQERIADNLGRFIEANFLDREAVRHKLREVDFAMMVADWLAHPRRADELARFSVRLVPQALAALDGSDFKSFIGTRLSERFEQVDLAPLAARLLEGVTAERRHQQLLDEMLKVFGRFLGDADALDALRDRIRNELPTLARFFKADAYLLKKIIASAETMIEEVRADPDHAMRREFDSFVAGFVGKLATSPDYAARAEAIKRDMLARPEFAALGDTLWESLRGFAEQDAASDESALRHHLAQLFTAIGRQLRENERMRADMNEGFVVALGAFVEKQKSGVSGFISDQVRRWDLGQLTHVIELNIGRDLQYIRFNGMIVGGLAGLLLHLAELGILAG